MNRDRSTCGRAQKAAAMRAWLREDSCAEARIEGYVGAAMMTPV